MARPLRSSSPEDLVLVEVAVPTYESNYTLTEWQTHSCYGVSGLDVARKQAAGMRRRTPGRSVRVRVVAEQ